MLRQTAHYAKLFIFLLIIVCLAACGNSKKVVTETENVPAVTATNNPESESTPEVSESPTTNEGGKNPTIESKGEDGKTTVSEYSDGKTLPSDFPKHIPIPDKAKITGSVKSTKEGVSSSIITLSTELKVDDLHKLYSDYMKEQKYTDVKDNLMGDVIIITGRLDGYTFSFMSAKEDPADKAILATVSWIQDKAE